jgi:hypothetical protein
MWHGEFTHPGLGPQSPASVHLDASPLDELVARDPASGCRLVVVLLGTGVLGGAADDPSEWRVGPAEPERLGPWLPVDWTFSATFGSQRTLACLARVDPEAIDVILPLDPLAPLARPERPTKKSFEALRKRGVVLELERGPRVVVPRSTAKLGTSIHRATVGLLKQLAKAVAAVVPRPIDDGALRFGYSGYGGPEVDARTAPADVLCARVWHVKLERPLPADAFWTVLRLRAGLHKFHSDWRPLFQEPAPCRQGWLRDLIATEKEDVAADGLEDFMEAVQTLGFEVCSRGTVEDPVMVLRLMCVCVFATNT